MNVSCTLSDICPICNEAFIDIDDIVQIGQKGADGINTASVKRKDNIVVTAGCRVHLCCRQSYINQRNIEQQQKKNDSFNNTLKRSKRLSNGKFDSKTDCLFCGTHVVLEQSDYSPVKTQNCTNTFLRYCEKRKDEWACIVKSRIEYYRTDLHAANSIYHHSCRNSFRNGSAIPFQFQDKNVPDAKRRKSGRPKNDDQEQAFERLCKYLENNFEEQITLTFLEEKMKSFLIHEDSDPYVEKYLKIKLREKYGENILFAERNGLKNIITFREPASEILRAYYDLQQKDGDEESQKRAIIEAAARLIKSDVNTVIPSVSDTYPKAEELKLDSAVSFLPETLHYFLTNLFVGKNTQRKVASIGQAIIQAVRPRAVIAPLQIGLAAQMHHLYRSRFLVDVLHEMGYCSSYDEVRRYEKNAANCITPDLLVEEADRQDVSILFAGDNVDHNILTIDGKNTFHGMGMIGALTPGKLITSIVKRQKISELNIADVTKVDIIEYRFSKHALDNIKFHRLPEIQTEVMKVDILWEISCHFEQPVPNWQGMMHTIHQCNPHPGKSSIMYLPIIDMYSGDKTCILSTLEFLSKLATRNHVPPIITFDQPLYWKGAEIIHAASDASDLKKIILMLGSFHTFMNLLGAIGTLMEGSGLKNILEVVYGENAVVHMMTGKSVQRAFRGHLLVDKCMNKLVTEAVIDEKPELISSIEETEKMYLSILNGNTTIESIQSSTTLSHISEELAKKRRELVAQSKTSQLWLGYQQMLSIAKSLIKADRMGSWENHLHAVYNALPVFAAAGHYNYLKSAYLYIQEMSVLEKKHPDVYKKFQDGFHVIRRTNKFWAGLSCDLVIEQTLMRSLKGTGGLTHGSKMTEEHRALWTMAAPVMSEVNSAMQEFTDLTYTTNDQHKEMTNTRVVRDAADFSKIFEKLSVCSPFSSEPTLRNVINGIVAEKNVNVNEFDSVGSRIIEKMVEQPIFSVSFKRSDKAVTLGRSSTVRVAANRTIEPNLLFQRFLVVSKSGNLSLEDVMGYELSPYPPSLFESNNILRKSDKSQLGHAISDHCNMKHPSGKISADIPQTERYILDGGSMLHKLKWKKGDTYGGIAKTYADFVLRHYKNVTVVFDGYNTGPSTKDNTHLRRGGIRNFPVINVTKETVFDGKREEFLSRGINKQHLIGLISEELRKCDCVVINADGDADVDITMAAVDAASTDTTTLIGEDTDLLVLLLHHTPLDSKPLYFRSDNISRKATNVYDIIKMKNLLGSDICKQLLFLHAFTGCDSTSHIYNIGKKSALQKLVNGNEILKSCAEKFCMKDKTHAEIEYWGSQVMLTMFGGDNSSSLAALRYELFTKRVILAKAFVTPERLPPTQSSTKYHSYRVYYQILTWMQMQSDTNPLDWGWKLQNNTYVPVMSDMNAAPDTLLKMVHCNCTTACSTTRCSCKRYGLFCSTACGPCQLDSCDNQNSKELQDGECDD